MPEKESSEGEISMKLNGDLQAWELRTQKFREDAEEELAGLKTGSITNSAGSVSDSPVDNLEYYKNEYFRYRQMYENIRDASFWKMTAPLRRSADFFRYLKTGQKRTPEYEACGLPPDDCATGREEPVLQPSLSIDRSDLMRRLEPYEIVTFDIFDTLLTRLVYQPDDLFRLMERRLKEQQGIEVRFLQKRKEAEALAWKEKGDFCNIYDIYDKLPEVSAFTASQSARLKEMEIALEYGLCVPRRDMPELYHELLKKKKRIFLLSDMYLPKDVIAGLLASCSYSGYEELWISCELGMRKDNGSMWEEFFRRYGGQNTIHIGDNPHSDGKAVTDRGREALVLPSPAVAFRQGGPYQYCPSYGSDRIENSLILGYAVNGCLYSSPFPSGPDGMFQINSLELLARGVYGPLFLSFCEYLQNTSHEDTIFLFLAREGYFFRKLYQIYCRAFKKKERENVYFLASRRAASIAALKDYSDARELLDAEFSGTMADLFRERFGILLAQSEGREHLELPRDTEKAVRTLKQYAADILAQAGREREHYLAYIRQELSADNRFNWDHVTVVDLGYAGSIQYYLMKLIGRPLDGCYLVRDYRMKPERLYGTTRGLYSFRTSRELDDNKLFLEAAAAAPHGQLLYFETKDGKEQPVFAEETSVCNESVEHLQQMICRYIEEIAPHFEGLNTRFDEELSRHLFCERLKANVISPELKGMFSVEDGYCTGGKWLFDERKCKWVVKKDT